MITNLQKQWRVQWRKSRKHPWKDAGLFETRDSAQKNAIRVYRVGKGVGLYNTRVMPYVK